MTFWFAPFSDLIKKKVCRYLLHRYLGSFIDEKINLNQLNVDFYNGTGTLSDVVLSPQALNDLCESQAWDIEVTAGHIGNIVVNVPWNALMSEDTCIEVSNLCFEIRPKCRPKDGASMIESMWSSMSSSMQLARDCLEREGGTSTQNAPMEGLERFAQIIDNVLNRIKVRLNDTEIRLDYLTNERDRGITLIAKIKKLEYRNEAGGDPPEKPPAAPDDNEAQAMFSIPIYCTHHITMENVTFYMEEFRICNGERVPVSMANESMVASSQFHSTISDLPDSDGAYQQQQHAWSQQRREDAFAATSSCSEDDDDDHLEVYRSQAIMLANVTGAMEMRVTSKQAANIQGPKVQLELQLGAINLLLTPRQLHALIYLSDIFLQEQPESERSQQIAAKREERMSGGSAAGDPDQHSNYRGNEFSAMSGGLGLNQGWSSDPMADAMYTTAYGYSPDQAETPFREVEEESSSSSMSGSLSSSGSQSTQTTNRARRRGIIDSDPNADILRLNVRVACCAIVLLQEDILVESSTPANGSPLGEDSVKKLKQISETYFDTVGEIYGDIGAKQMHQTGLLLDKGCKNNHLRLILAPIIIEGEEQRNAIGNLLCSSVSIPRADLKEVLSDVTVPLLEFHRDQAVGGLPKRPEITIGIKQTTHLLRSSSGSTKFGAPRTEVNFSLAPCLLEFDISILDRLNAILNSSPFQSRDVGTPIEECSGKKHSMPKTDLVIESSSIDVILRFPVTDLRPIHNSDRVPWWKRNVLKDYFSANFTEAKLTLSNASNYEICAEKIDLFYNENETEPRIHVANCVTYERPAKGLTPAIIERPKISIHFPSTEALTTYLHQKFQSDDSSDGGLHSDIGFQMPKQKDSTPFSSKHVWRESDTPHSRSNPNQNNDGNGNNSVEDEKLLIPGDTTEMNKFCEEAEKSSKFQINVSLPVVSLQLKSKHLYEVMYNRIISNLLLWSPSAPSTVNAAKPANIQPNPLFNVGMTDSVFLPFSMAKSNIHFGSSSSATNSESEAETESIYYSAYYENKRQAKAPANIVPIVDNSSKATLKLIIGQGMLTMYSPVRDSANHVIPGQLGEFVIKVNSASVFSVSGFRGNENLNYMCVQASAAEIFHFGLIPVPSANPPLRVIGCALPSHVQSTIYPTPRGLTVQEPLGHRLANREMISIAVQIKSQPEMKIKRIKVSAGIQLATLRYNSALPEHSWLHQIMDVFNVVDYPIHGYTPLNNVTEMHLHLWECSVDYRPRFYDYRAVVTLSTFTISSNLSTASSGCTVRFIAEDGTLSIAPQNAIGEHKLKNENKITVLPSNDLVCVFEFALLEISLRENEKATDHAPKFDARGAMNGAHLRVCSDSCLALGNLFAYIATEGDLPRGFDKEDDEGDQLITSREMEADLLAVNAQAVPEVTEDQQQRVNQLMEEAMQDCVRVPEPARSDSELVEDDTDVFYFPDEAQPGQHSLPTELGITSSSGLRRSSRSSRSNSSLNRDDEDNVSVQTDCSRRRTTDLQDIIDFETSIMGLKSAMETEVTEAIPQVATDLGTITSRKKQLSERNRKISSDTDDDFCFIGDEEKPKYGFDGIQPSEEPIRIVDNHFSVPLDKHDMLRAPQGFPQAVTRYTLCDLTVSLHFYGGNDFPDGKNPAESSAPKAKDSELAADHFIMSDAYKKGVSYSKESSRVTFVKSNSKTPRSKRSWKERGGVNRNFDICVEVHSSKGKFSHETYPSNAKEASRQVLVLSEFEVWDRLSCSAYNKMFYTGSSERSKKSDQATMYVKCIFIRPEPTLRRQEANLYISFMPKVNINIDQDAMIFLTEFFAHLNGSENETARPARAPATPTHQPPVMIVDMPEAQEYHARKMVNKNLMLLIDEEGEKEKTTPEANIENETDNSPMYFRSITFSPEVELTINYAGKRVEMSHGPLMGLVMGLGQLNCSKIKLRKIVYRRGLLGIDRVLHFLVKEWLNDIKNRQLPSLLQGIGPMNSIVIFFQGIIDLFRLPIEQYQRDGRIVRGIQLGAQSFTSRTALAALELTTRLIYLLQITAETAYDMVSPGPSVRRIRGKQKGKRKFHTPQDIREGVTNAYYIVKEGVGDTAHTIVEMAALEHDQKGMTGAVGAVIRQIPPAVVKPIVLATQATSNVLGGVRNQLVPDARREAKEKWKDDED